MQSALFPYELMAARSIERRGGREATAPLYLPACERRPEDAVTGGDKVEADFGIAADGPACGSESDDDR